jgi:hypothetical protein
VDLTFREIAGRLCDVFGSRALRVIGGFATLITVVLVCGSSLEGSALSAVRGVSASDPVASLGGPNGSAGVGSSVAVSADGTTTLVGATAVDANNGGAFVFHVSSPVSWANSSSPTATLTIPEVVNSGLEVAFSADGTTAFVAPSGGAHAVVYVFHASAEDAWSSSAKPRAILSAARSSSCDSESIAVSSDGTTAVVGCGRSGGAAAYVFHVRAEDAWATTSRPRATLTDGSRRAQDYFGSAVSLSSNGATALVGAPGVNTRSGAAFIFHVAGENAWATSSKPTATLPDLTGFNGDLAGASVAISADGATALIGSSQEGVVGQGQVHGDAYVFVASSAASWKSVYSHSTLSTSTPMYSDTDIGSCVALSFRGTSAFANSPGYPPYDGVFLFHAASESAWHSAAQSSPTLSAGGYANSPYGCLALSANRSIALVGLGYPGDNGGTAEIFSLPAETAQPCVVPNVKGKRLAAAELSIDSRGCSLGMVTKATSPTVKKGRVISQTPRTGRHLKPWAQVCLVVSKGA